VTEELTPGKGRRAIDAARSRARDVAAWVEAARPRHGTIDVSFAAVDRDRRIAAGVLAGGIAFRIFLWTLPLALTVAGVLGLVDAAAAKRGAESLGITGAGATAVQDAAAASSKNSWWMLTAGSVLLVWTGASVVRALELVHGAAWGVPPRRAAGILKSGLVFSGAAAGVLAVIGLVSWAHHEHGVDRSLFLAVAGIVFGVWLFASWRLPRHDVPLRALIPGALLVGLGGAAMQALSDYILIPKLTHKSEIYGALGIAATLLVWLFVLGRLMVASAIFNASLEERRRHQSEPGE
jgi:uncharacterized BrkB/YihY/UPF0761 family membrane protein